MLRIKYRAAGAAAAWLLATTSLVPATAAGAPAPTIPEPVRSLEPLRPASGQAPLAPAPAPPTAAIPVTAAPATAMPANLAPTRPSTAPVPEPVKVSADPRPTFSSATFVATMAAVERYRSIAEAGGWPLVPNGVTRLKLGDRNAIVAVLRRRLATTGDVPADAAAGDTFDAALAAGVKLFQFRHGLPEEGILGPRTLVELNVPVETRIRQLQASAGRLLGSTFPFGERYVAVNIPSATVEAVQGGAVVRRYVAIVGKSDRPSPTVGARIQTVNFNPTWTVPVSLIKKDIIPHMRKDPGYLAKMKIRILDNTGGEIDPATIDWSTERAANYLLRQDPGVDNSLGEVRIDMPNKMAVYMHDTPSKRLFARSSRTNSSGCVRVAGVRDLAGWLLEGVPGPGGPGSAWHDAEMQAAIATGRRIDVKLPRSVPVAWVYLTGYAMPDGTVHFRPDVYSLDDPAPNPGPIPPASVGPAPVADVPQSSAGAALRQGGTLAAAPLPMTMDTLVTNSLREHR